MLTGCRRDEIGGLCWSEIDLDAGVITLPPARTKIGANVAQIPLSTQATEILKAQPRRLGSDGSPCDFVFGRYDRGYSGWSKSRRELDARLAEMGKPIAEEWWLHDFRRAISTALHERFDIAPHVVEAILNHASGHRGGVAGVYNRASYDAQKQIALEKWGDHIEAQVTGKRRTAVVRKLHRHR